MKYTNNLAKIYALLFFGSFTVIAWGQNPIDAATSFLLQNQSKNQQVLTKENLVVSSSHTSQQSGLTHIYFNQTFGGIKIYNAITNVAVDRAGKVFSTSNRFVDFKTVDNINPSINALSAIQHTARYFRLEERQATLLIKTEPGLSTKTSFKNESLSERDIVTELMYVHQNDQLILCWSVAIEKSDDHYFWDVKVGAVSGEIMEKTSWTVECNFNHGQELCDHSTHKHTAHKSKSSAHPTGAIIKKSAVVDGDYTVIPMPFESPSHGPITVVNAPWTNNIDASAHPFDWHNDGSNTHFTTRGNNVWAVEDANDDNNQSTGFSPDSQLGGNKQQYNFIPDFLLAPPDYQEAAITNLFYWNNIVHDVMYHYGFDEASGNFQETNATGSGSGSDGVQADAQDGSGNNNANFSTPPDGSNPRMQMFQWTQSGSSTFDVTTPFVDSYFTIPASFGPNATFSGTVIDILDTTGNSKEACTANPISNGAAINGNIALIDRGNCQFAEKISNAESNGAIAVVMCNNVPGNPIPMGEGDGPIPSIPSVMISQSDCATLRTQLPVTINVTSPVNLDSDYDNGVIVHEYGHGISTRLTGGSANSGCLNGEEQMGEGWSDFFGLIMTIEAGDSGLSPRGIGTYVRGQPTTGNGIRPYPYSTDLSINPMTYGFTDNGGSITIPHGVGSVWATMLWEMTWELIDIYGIGTDIYESDINNNTGTPSNPGRFGGQNLALQLVIEGLKLQPCRPGFVDGRDAILAADKILYGGIHTCAIWDAFIKRGLGPNAKQGSSLIVLDNVESFTEDPIFIEKTVDAPLTLNGTSLSYTIDVSHVDINCGTSATNLVVTDVLDPGFSISSMICSPLVTISNSGNTVTMAHPGLVSGESFSCEIKVTVNNSAGPIVNMLFDDVESGNIGWTFRNIEGDVADQWAIVNTMSNSPTNSWFIQNTDGPDRTHTLESPAVSLGQNPTLSFSHQFITEANWDGGFIQISTNNGNSWRSLEISDFYKNGYNSILGTNENDFIAKELAWSGNSNGFIQTIVHLEDYANQSIKFRFVFGQDDNTNATGWWIDDIAVTLNKYAIVTNLACLESNQSLTPICNEVKVAVELKQQIPCEPEYSAANGNLLSGTQILPTDYEATGIIESEQIISSSTVVDYDSSTQIELTAGFEVELSSIFHAFIDGCGGVN